MIRRERRKMEACLIGLRLGTKDPNDLRSELPDQLVASREVIPVVLLVSPLILKIEFIRPHKIRQGMSNRKGLIERLLSKLRSIPVKLSRTVTQSWNRTPQHRLPSQDSFVIM